MSSRPLHILSAVMVLGLCSFGLVGSALAQHDSEIAREKAAKKACALGDYEKGTEILADLLVETDNVVYIFNQGRCYQQNDRWERAIARFREFLRKAENLTRAQRAQTERHIAECEAALRRSEPPAAPAPPHESPPRSEPSVPTPVPRQATEAQAPPANPTSNAPPSSPVSNPGRGLRIAGLVLGGVGVAAIGSGVFCTLKTRSITSNERKYGATPAQEDERKRYETWGWVSYGVGAAALTTGVVLYLVGWPTSESGQLALLPRVNSTGADLLLTGRF